LHLYLLAENQKIVNRKFYFGKMRQNIFVRKILKFDTRAVPIKMIPATKTNTAPECGICFGAPGRNISPYRSSPLFGYFSHS